MAKRVLPASDDFTYQVAVEDHFAIIDMEKPNGLLPDGHILEKLAILFNALRGEYTPVLDMTGLSAITNDVVDFVTAFAELGASIILDPSSEIEINGKLPPDMPVITGRKLSPIGAAWAAAAAASSRQKIDQTLLSMIDDGERRDWASFPGYVVRWGD